VSERARKYHEAHKEEINAKSRARHHANKEVRNARKKAWYEANKDHVRAYEHANKERIAARKKEHSQLNRDRIRARVQALRESNPELYRERRRRQVARATDAYIRKLYKTPMPPDLIQAARMKLFIKRKLRELKDEKHQ